MINKLKEELPKASVAMFDPVHGDVMDQATNKVFGKSARQSLHLSEAKVIVALQADLLGSDSQCSSNTRGFAALRDPAEHDGEMSRLYVVEAGYSQTGASADCRLALRPSEMPAFLSELGRRIDAASDRDDSVPETAFDELGPAERLERFLDALAPRPLPKRVTTRWWLWVSI